MRLLTVLAVVGGAVLAGIGFTGSYSALVRLGQQHHFGWFAHVFPVGIDAGIVVLLALDLHMIRKHTPWPVVRLVAHFLTVCTIAFNAASAPKPIREDLVGAAMHGVLPVLFIVSVEAGRKLVMQAANIAAGTESAGVPLHRWLLSPFSSGAMFRRIKLYDLTSYPQAVKLEKARIVYRVMLERQYGSIRKAPSDARLPLTMAKYGLSVDEALALPEEAEEAERLRIEQKEQRRIEAQARAAQRAAQAEIARLRAEGQITTARLSVAAETGVAEAQARAAQAQADALAAAQARAAEKGAAAIESADAAEANKRAAEADKAAAETRRRTAETNQAAAEVEKAAAEARRIAAAERQAAADAEERAEAARKRAAEAQLRAVETRAAAAEVELRAVEAEDMARLSPKERGARKVARMILATGSSDAEQVELTAIADALGVSITTASERRREAVDLLNGGYRP
ncbi:DUF2637 domain-containing protein [Streptomyces albidochromogenes]|uniref:DUF2637 domain-containing protein n=1 Tax=Streptomyces albidochromogenes TaxID=329524 RepID=UPI00110F919D|nr:DUF2637 domain-containing protein [Streptomyces albidochromogenes]